MFGSAGGCRSQPVELSAAKSSLGHAEPAAGAAGMLHALHCMHSGSAVGLLHLTAANPYIVGSLEQAQEAAPTCGAMLWMPRAPSARGISGAAADAIGVSGFAFQGTNAHVILARLPTLQDMRQLPNLTALAAGSCSSGAAAAWQPRRHWFMPTSHRLLGIHVPRGTGSSRFETELTFSPALAYLWQHRVSGRAIMPGAAMLEAGFAAAASLLPGEVQGTAALVNAGIAAPLLLVCLGSGKTLAAQTLLLKVQQYDGVVELSSRTAHGRPALHLSASACDAAVPRKPHAAAVYVPLPVAASALLQQAAAGALPTWQGASVGSLTLLTASPSSDGYQCHPAAVDAATHLGALLDLELGAAARVPVALGAYSSCGAELTDDALLTSAGCGQVALDGSRTSSFGLVSAAGLPALRLQGLRSLPLGARPAAPTEATRSAAEASAAADCYTYATVWQAAAPAVGTASQGAAATIASGNVSLLSSSGMVAMSQATPSEPLHVQALQGYGPALCLLQTLDRGLNKQPWLTAVGPCGTVGTTSGSKSQVTSAAAVGGLLRVAALEQPLWQLGLSLLDSNRQAGPFLPSSPGAHGAATAGSTELWPQLLLSMQAPASSRPQPAAAWPTTHVITGGLGGLGLLAASWLPNATTPPCAMLLLGRSGRLAVNNNCVPSAIHMLVANDAAHITLTQCDIAATEDALAALVDAHASLPPLASFVHTAGVLADRLIGSQTMADAQRVFAPKLAGLAAAAPALDVVPLRQSLLFSSVSAALGNRGQAPYAAANAALDSIAHAMQLRGAAGTSVQWGAWAGAGMAAATPQLLLRLARQGLGAIHPAHGLLVLTQAMYSSLTSLPVMLASPLIWRVLLAAQPSPAFAGMAEALGISETGANKTEAPPASWTAASKRQRRQGAGAYNKHSTSSVAEWEATVLPRVLAAVAETLGSAVEAGQSLMEAGLDSLGKSGLDFSPI